MDTGTHGHRDSWTQGGRDTGRHGDRDAWTQEHREAWWDQPDKERWWHLHTDPSIMQRTCIRHERQRQTRQQLKSTRMLSMDGNKEQQMIRQKPKKKQPPWLSSQKQ